MANSAPSHHFLGCFVTLRPLACTSWNRIRCLQDSSLSITADGEVALSLIHWPQLTPNQARLRILRANERVFESDSVGGAVGALGRWVETDGTQRGSNCPKTVRSTNCAMIRTKKVLVAEDQPMDICLLQRAFAQARMPITVYYVEDGQEAIDYLSGEKEYGDRDLHPLPDFLLLDIKMPRLDGFQVLRWLRNQPGLKRLPVAMFSSSDLANDVNRAYELGANSFLVKPQDPDRMSDLVRRLEDYWLELNAGPEGLAR